MIFRLSQKIAKKIKAKPTQVLPLDSNPYADWSAHLFTANRSQYILLTNTASLYSAVIVGRGVASESQLIEQGLNCIQELLIDDGLEFIFRKFIAPSTATVIFSKALSRSVTGSMNDLVYHAQVWLTEGELSPHDTSFQLNEMPMSALDYANPREALKSLVIDDHVRD